jgi:outer membrane protein
MIARYGLLVGLSIVAAAAQAFAQSAAPQPAGGAAWVDPAKIGPAKPIVIKPAYLAKPAKSTTPRPDMAQSGTPRTLAEALAITYATQPALQAERAKLRATDENVPQALSGWRPTVVITGTAGYGDGMTRTYASTLGTTINARTQRDIGLAQTTLTQPLYTGGKTQAQINRAKNLVAAERAQLIAQEQTSFINAVGAYVNVIQAQQLLALNVNNEQVLVKQLQATNERFRVGEVTRTDVAQAEAALASATAQRQTAEGNLQTARGTFQQVVGYLPPGDLEEPQPLSLPVKTEQEATALASANNPSVINALFNDAAAKDAIDVTFSQLLPQVNLQGQVLQQQNQSDRSTSQNGYQATVNLSVPIYQGGVEYSVVRQARQQEQQAQKLIDDARRTAVQNTVQAWEGLVAARASAGSTKAAIQANTVALDGVEREAIIGSRTTLDVLNAQQALLNSETTLVQNLAQLVTASYQVAAAVGRLTARDLHLSVPLYDETAYYNAVKNKWVGLGDYATQQPGR